MITLGHVSNVLQRLTGEEREVRAEDADRRLEQRTDAHDEWGVRNTFGCSFIHDLRATARGDRVEARPRDAARVQRARSVSWSTSVPRAMFTPCTPSRIAANASVSSRCRVRSVPARPGRLVGTVDQSSATR